ncbi:MAG: hypothetical protein AAB420_04435 [Patescibacteria group bacterium]
MEIENREPPITLQEKIGDAKNRRSILEQSIGAFCSPDFPKYTLDGKLVTVEEIKKLIEELRDMARRNDDQKVIDRLLDDLPISPNDIRNVVKQIIDLDGEIATLENV